jgi:hypothetical protein
LLIRPDIRLLNQDLDLTYILTRTPSPGLEVDEEAGHLSSPSLIHPPGKEHFREAMLPVEVTC